MSLTYIIDAPNYDKNVGGICALHYLADRLGTHTDQVFLTTHITNARWRTQGINRNTPFFLGNDQTRVARFYQFLTRLKQYVYFKTFVRKINRLQKRLFPSLLWNYFDKTKTVVIYPEITLGNPLHAKHIVRWILNTPGVCGGNGVFGPHDHIFQYHPWYPVDTNYTIRGVLTAIDLGYQLKTYYDQKLSTRQGGAYLIRKGRAKEHNQHPDDFIYADPLLEKMTDEEAADFFNRLETFISYDDMTWISVQAALCGCKSIIIPGDGDRSEENLKKVNRINGVAYGFEDWEWLNQTHSLLRPQFEKLNTEYLRSVDDFYHYCEREIR
jgi:hypothetical protein